MKVVAPFAEAEAEIDDALAASRDPVAFRAVIEAAIQDVATGLRTHGRIARSPCRRCILPKPYPYSIVYLETDAEIQIVALQHHKRRANYWKSRPPTP